MTITKLDVAELTLEEYVESFGGESLNIQSAKRSVDLLVQLITGYLSDFKMVKLKRYGTLVPHIKSGGRPVRNPKTGDAMRMGDTCTVTLSRNKQKRDKTSGKINTSDLILDLSDLISNDKGCRCDYPEILSDITVRMFIKSIRDSASNDVRVEFRGLGVFKSKHIDGYLARNPKTGESVEVDDSRRPSFKLSSLLKKKMNADKLGCAM